MKNLENYCVQNMNTKEIDETNGGGLLILPISGFILGYLYERYVAN
jgi:hypothetical protein